MGANRIAVVLLAFAVVMAAGAGRATAQNDAAKKQAAKVVYDKAKTAYNLGDWDEAIRLFQETYKTYPFRNVLYDIGQANRHGARCKDAVFFYKRFLQVKPDTPNRAEVEGFIKECQDMLAKQPTGTAAGGPTTTTTLPTETTTGAGDASAGTHAIDSSRQTDGAATTTSGPSISGNAPDNAPGDPASLIVLTVQAGPAFVGLLEGESTPVQPTFDLTVAYPLQVGPLVIEAGIRLGYTRVPWETEDMQVSGDLGLLSLTAGAGVSYQIFDRFSVRGEIGLGDLVMLGVDEERNPFTDRAFDSGAASLFHGRIALGAQYAVLDNLVITAHPLTYWRASRIDGLADAVSRVAQFSVVVGVSYRR